MTESRVWHYIRAQRDGFPSDDRLVCPTGRRDDSQGIEDGLLLRFRARRLAHIMPRSFSARRSEQQYRRTSPASASSQRALADLGAVALTVHEAVGVVVLAAGAAGEGTADEQGW